MKHRKVEMNVDRYRLFYKKISGGIDGYYEKTILEGDCYEVYEENTLAYFTLHKERGLTSLVVLEDYETRYTELFNFVLGLNVFDKMMFTENDLSFLSEVQKRGFLIETQSYNFEVNKEVKSEIQMTPTTTSELEALHETFGEFIKYNEMNLRNMASFYLMENDDLIAFGGLESLILNENRFCISMIVNEQYRGQGYGSEVVRYLIEFLQLNLLEVNARCYVKNEASKRTLLRAGMVISNTLLKVEGMDKSQVKSLT